MAEAKPFDVPKGLVWEAYKRVKANRGAGGVDGQCLDGYHPRFYDSSPEVDPVAPLEQRVFNRVYRGGGFRNTAPALRVAYRSYGPPTLNSLFVGVRPARGIDP